MGIFLFIAFFIYIIGSVQADVDDTLFPSPMGIFFISMYLHRMGKPNE